VASEAKNVVHASEAAAGVQTPAHEGAAASFWRILTRFDSSKLQPYLALRNTVALEAGWGHMPPPRTRAEFGVFAEVVEKTLGLLAKMYREEKARAKDFPDLREDHQRLPRADPTKSEQYAPVNVEGDRITNSLNTLAEQVTEWVRTQKGG